MRFDMSRAWNDAIASVSANREVMMVVGGIFFLLPSLVFSLLFADIQLEAMAQLQQMAAGQLTEQTSLAGMGATFVVLVLALLLFQMVGYTALLALLDDRDRPTVGEALSRAIRFIPTLIGMIVVLIIVYIACAFVVGLVGALLIAATESVALAVILGLVLFALVLYALTRLSLATAVVVLETQYNPVAALVRSWRLTKADAWRILGFYVLLLVVYFVISIILAILLAGIAGVAGGSIGQIVNGLISGFVSAVVSVIFVGILASIHRQLAGPSTANLNETFG